MNQAIWILAGALALPALRASAQDEMGPEREQMEAKEAEEGKEHPMLSDRFLDALEQQLKLKEGQKKRMQEALDASREPLQKKFDEMRDLKRKMEETERKLRSITQDLREKLRAALDNEQKERFDEMMLRMRGPEREMGPRGKQPFGRKGLGQEERPQFPPERWEEDPERGRRPRG
ncbi:MAG: hypothetical protein HY922_17565 [Elusimicrobia bacterium]|nr:hypothetical protein [Elusimicrobiota bacterium]